MQTHADRKPVRKLELEKDYEKSESVKTTTSLQGRYVLVESVRNVNRNINYTWDGNSGLMVMEGDSCSKGREFESPHHILDGHF